MPALLLVLPLLFGALPGPGAVCPPEYYEIALVPTGRVPGTGGSTGTAAVAFAQSPFGIAVSPDGSYVYDLHLTLRRLPPARDGVYTVWISTPDLKQIERVGPLGAGHRATGRVSWNKFLVIVTLEPDAAASAKWRGPVVLRGLSRSGLMHTMAGHGPFQSEPCATYGYF